VHFSSHRRRPRKNSASSTDDNAAHFQAFISMDSSSVTHAALLFPSSRSGSLPTAPGDGSLFTEVGAELLTSEAG
jgi:hypothetical protein